MKVSVRGRALAMAVVAGSLLTVPFATPALAAQSAACAKVTTAPLGKAKTITATFASCTPASLAAGGGASFTNPPTGTTKGTLKLTITWKGGKGTTLGLVTFAQNKTLGKCPKGELRETVTGKVTGGSGAAAKIIKKNEPITSSTCAVTTGPKLGSSSLEPGTKLKL